jgi:hypothetical protein
LICWQRTYLPPEVRQDGIICLVEQGFNPAIHDKSPFLNLGRSSVVAGSHNAENKKADVAEHPKVFDHAGLLSNEPPGTAGLLFI